MRKYRYIYVVVFVIIIIKICIFQYVHIHVFNVCIMYKDAIRKLVTHISNPTAVAALYYLQQRCTTIVGFFYHGLLQHQVLSNNQAVS